MTMPMTLATSQSVLASWAAAGYGLWQGIWILTANPARWGSPGAIVLNTFPAAPYSWGVWAALAGFFIVAGVLTRDWIVKVVGLVALSIWAATFGVLALITAFTAPVITTGGPTYLFVAFLLAALAGYRDRNVGLSRP